MSRANAPFLAAEDICLSLPTGRELLRDVSLSLGRERTGLVGANGVGKSLLLDILAGARVPTSGRVVRQGTVAYVPQGRTLAATPGETVSHRLGVYQRLAAVQRLLDGGSDPQDLDAVGPDGWDLAARVDAELSRFGLGHLGLHRMMEALSGGEATRVTLLGAFLATPDVLILDEPTNDLDLSSRRALAAMVEEWSGGLLVVSHDRTLLRQVDRIIELTPGGVRVYGGDYDHFRELRDQEAAAAGEALAQAQAARRKVEAEARRVLDRESHKAARGARSRGDGSQSKLVLNAKREQSQKSVGRRSRTLEELDREARERVMEAQARFEEEARPRMEVGPSQVPAGKEIVRLQGVSYTYPGASGPILTGVDLGLRGPERVAVTGPNGSGKTTLLQLMAGMIQPSSGTVRVGLPPDRVAYLDQTTRLLHDGDTVLGCFRHAHAELEEGFARHILARFLFAGDAALAPVAQLSGGERMRAGLACLLGGTHSPGLLILDEPTNHLDLLSLETVEGAVAAFDGALVVVSHDPDFLAAAGVEREMSLRGH